MTHPSERRPNTADQAVADELASRREAKEAAHKLAVADNIIEALVDAKDGMMISFVRQYVGTDQLFDFVAIFKKGLWYTTQLDQSRPINLEDFVLWLVSGIPVDVITTLRPDIVLNVQVSSE